jgi:hypothetical protein
MKLSDARDIRAEPAAVWAAILDPAILMRCIPGCQSMTGSVAEGFEAVVKQKVGPVSATFSGLVQLSDIVEGRSLRISGEGKGGVAGFAKGGAEVHLEPIAGGTRLTYAAEAAVGGKLAQLGSRIIDSFARKLADEFFARFQAAVEPPEAPAAPVGADAPEPAMAGAEAAGDRPARGWLRRIFG